MYGKSTEKTSVQFRLTATKKFIFKQSINIVCFLFCKERNDIMGGRGASSLSGSLISKHEIKYNSQLMNLSKESAVVFNDEGKQILFKNGEWDRVKFSQKELDKMYEMNFTHNHPTSSHYDSLFSKQDISFAFDTKVKSMSTVNKLGEIRTLKQNSYQSKTKKKPGYLSSDYDYELLSYGRGHSTSQTASHMDKWLKKNAKDYGYSYSIKKNKKINKE